jgi:hypothetical protein
MKPTKSKVFCVECKRYKMLFETEKKADTFMKFNSIDIELETGYSPTRSYYCVYCGGYHVTSKAKISINSYGVNLDSYSIHKQKIISSIIRNNSSPKLNERLYDLEQELKDINNLLLEDKISDMFSLLEKCFYTLENIKKVKGYKKRKTNIEVTLNNIKEKSDESATKTNKAQ